MKKILVCLFALLMLGSFAFAEMPYESIRMEFEDGFALDLPSDWMRYDVGAELADRGFIYCLGTSDASRLLYVQRWAADYTNLSELQEALAAQELLGMKNAGFLGFADKNDNSEREISLKVVEVIRKIKPDYVLTVDPNLATECHSDHIKVGNAVKYACMDALCDFYPEFKDGGLRDDAWRVKGVGFYYTDKPNTLVDITDFEELKMESIKCHKSQAEPTLLAAMLLQHQVYAEGTAFKAAEPLRLLSNLQMHCFNLPVE